MFQGVDRECLVSRAGEKRRILLRNVGEEADARNHPHGDGRARVPAPSRAREKQRYCEKNGESHVQEATQPVDLAQALQQAGAAPGL